MTDHENLTYINQNTSPKVLRWKMVIQQYDCDIKHIPGRMNIVADGFSRHIRDLREKREDSPEEEEKRSNWEVREEFSPTDYCSECSSETLSEHRLLVMHNEDLPKEVIARIARVHNSKSGHHGVDRTLRKLRVLKDEWPHMRSYTSFYQYVPILPEDECIAGACAH